MVAPGTVRITRNFAMALIKLHLIIYQYIVSMQAGHILNVFSFFSNISFSKCNTFRFFFVDKEYLLIVIQNPSV
jgi:hypothetical protein